jgi:hypothetical protein
MNPAMIFAKTAKGREEIEKRTHRLEAKRRMLLIVVDGSANAQALASKAVGGEADGMAILQSLWTEGFIEPAGAYTGANIEIETAPPAVAGQSLQELKRKASHAIEQILGPNGETMALKLEKVTTMEQFLAEAHKTRDALRQFAGQRKSDQFWAALGL